MDVSKSARLSRGVYVCRTYHRLWSSRIRSIQRPRLRDPCKEFAEQLVKAVFAARVICSRTKQVSKVQSLMRSPPPCSLAINQCVVSRLCAPQMSQDMACRITAFLSLRKLEEPDCRAQRDLSIRACRLETAWVQDYLRKPK